MIGSMSVFQRFKSYWSTKPQEDVDVVAQTCYASFGRRFVASFLDNIFQVVCISTPIYYLYLASPNMNYDGAGPIWLELFLMTCFILLCWCLKGATPGKMLLKMKILDAKTLQPVPAWRLCLRFLAYFIALAPCLLGFFMVLWTEKKQGLHDKIAGTVVVLEQKKHSAQESSLAE